VVIGKNVAIGRIDNDARSCACDLARAATGIWQPEKAPEHFVTIGGLRLNGLADTDVDDCRCDLLDEWRQAGQWLTVNAIG